MIITPLLRGIIAASIYSQIFPFTKMDVEYRLQDGGHFILVTMCYWLLSTSHWHLVILDMNCHKIQQYSWIISVPSLPCCVHFNWTFEILVNLYWPSMSPSCTPWWRHQMETFSALLAICNSPVIGDFSSQNPVTRSFEVFFDLHMNVKIQKYFTLSSECIL